MMDMKLHAPKLIVVDDLDLLASDRFYKSEIDSVKNNINELIAIGKECDCAVLTASQVGRDAFGKKKVGGQNVAGTINKVFKADLFLMVYKTQEKVRDYFGNEREAVKHYMLVDRNRHGVGGGIYELDVDMASARVFDVLPEGHNLVQHRRVS